MRWEFPPIREEDIDHTRIPQGGLMLGTEMVADLLGLPEGVEIVNASIEPGSGVMKFTLISTQPIEGLVFPMELDKFGPRRCDSDIVKSYMSPKLSERFKAKHAGVERRPSID